MSSTGALILIRASLLQGRALAILRLLKSQLRVATSDYQTSAWTFSIW